MQNGFHAKSVPVDVGKNMLHTTDRMGLSGQTVYKVAARQTVLTAEKPHDFEEDEPVRMNSERKAPNHNQVQATARQVQPHVYRSEAGISRAHSCIEDWSDQHCPSPWDHQRDVH